MSTPAIIKQPAFEFDEAGMGLLSKRKLEELVKQIDPEERLDPDVEEVCFKSDWIGLGTCRLLFCIMIHHYPSRQAHFIPHHFPSPFHQN